MKRELKMEKSCFDLFWEAWPKSPRKASKSICEKKWKAKGLDKHWRQIHKHVTWLKTTDMWRKSDGNFIPAPLVYLNQERWDGAEIPELEITVTVGYKDPALKKIEEDAKIATQMPDEIKKQLAEIKKKFLSV
jgi:hypothetical protein